MRKTGGSFKKNTAVVLAAALWMSGIGQTVYGPWIVNAWAAPEALEEESGESVSGTEETTDAVAIRTVEDLQEFSRNCISESYSMGKQFVLEADLNLQGTEVQPIPVFAGTFDGKGHSVIGLSVKSAGSDLGLFRFVQEGGTVKNLQVHGNIMPEGSRNNIGGIAGTNRGIIENCSFSGTIMAEDTLGGIAGHNEITGVIRGCESQAELTGNLKTGGIAGYNEGQIENCINRGDVNASGQEVTSDSSTQLSPGSVGLEESVRVERVNDAGGIAGLSLGYIKECSNYGAVGYPHMGYNMGGIAGRQSGLVDQCQNYGNVQGRKDTGGIVGQFEPYVSVDYEEDMFGTLENQIDTLSDMGDSLSGIIDNAGDTASANLDQIDTQAGRLQDIGRFYKDVYRRGGDDFDRDMDRSIDDIQDILDHMNLELAGPATRMHYQNARGKVRQIKDLRAEMEKGYDGEITDGAALKAWLEKRRQQLEQLGKYGQELTAELAWLAANAPADMIGGAEDFGDDLENLQVETSVLMDIISSDTDKARSDLHSMDEEMTAQVDVLTGSVDTFTDGLKDSRLQLRDQKNQIMNQIDQMRNTISDGVDRAREDKELFEDVSDLEGEGLGEGMVNGCVNQGTVSADYQAGGIVGIIGMETSLDPEQDLEAEEERTLNVTRNIKAIVLDCRNEEHITVTNDYAGGIVGKANLGALIQNQNYGDITAKEGNYAGGITGSSAYVLRRNYSMCTIEGNNYAGGIAGWGTDILDNYSMVSFTNPEGEWIGAVAGDADEEGVIQGNFYVEEHLGALDGVTYEGQAKGLSYEDFRSMENMPEQFGRLSVVFLVEDEVLKTVYCEYGSGVPQEEIPQVPQKDGYYYEWEKKDLSCVRGNQKVHAIYKAWNTTIASSDDKMPVLLAEANFYPGTYLMLKKQGPEEEENRAKEAVWLVPENYVIGGVYDYSVVQPEGVPMPEKITVHVLADSYKKNCVVGIVDNGEVRITDSRWDGPYLVFEMDGMGEFVILEPEKDIMPWIMLAGTVIILLVICLILKKMKKRKAQPVQEADEEAEKTLKETEKAGGNTEDKEVSGEPEKTESENGGRENAGEETAVTEQEERG